MPGIVQDASALLLVLQSTLDGEDANIILSELHDRLDRKVADARDAHDVALVGRQRQHIGGRPGHLPPVNREGGPPGVWTSRRGSDEMETLLVGDWVSRAARFPSKKPTSKAATTMTTPMAKLKSCARRMVGCAAFWRRGSRLSRRFRMTGLSPD